MKLIDKDKIVSEIKKLISQNELYLSENASDLVRFQKTSAYSVLNNVLHFLDTLEVKEVNLEDYDKVKKVLSLSFMEFLDNHRSECKMRLSNGECFDIDKAFDEFDFAKLFRYMEKYLKVQKGENYE